ncbi:MAG: hypothetical protein DBX55_07310 [Verrucomicrobia bacterium]|nr:MAG: hypothetical protein DBX55_07310 [Verrucomicrobiota bacterium]
MSRWNKTGLRAAVFFARWQSFFSAQKTTIGANLFFIFVFFLPHAESFAPRANPRADFNGQRKARRTNLYRIKTIAQIPTAPIPNFTMPLRRPAFSPRSALFLLYKRPVFNNE